MPGKTCFFQKCKNNSANQPDRCFVPFVKPHIDMKRCRDWIQLSGRFIPPDKISKNSYICDEHFDLHQVLDWKINPNLRPIPTYRLKKVDAKDVPGVMPVATDTEPMEIDPVEVPDSSDLVVDSNSIKKLYSKSNLENTIGKNINNLEEIMASLHDERLKNVISEIIQDFNERKR